MGVVDVVRLLLGWHATGRAPIPDQVRSWPCFCTLTPATLSLHGLLLNVEHYHGLLESAACERSGGAASAGRSGGTQQPHGPIAEPSGLGRFIGVLCMRHLIPDERSVQASPDAL